MRLIPPCASFALLVAMSTAALATGHADTALPTYAAQGQPGGRLASIGDDAMGSLMDAWLAEFRARQPDVRIGRWEHMGAATVFGALMFETADLAPLARAPRAEEIAPYKHQFAGDMMPSPLLVRVATRTGEPAYIAVNKRPGAPLPPPVREFLAFALSRDGQQVVERDAAFAPIDAPTAAAERTKLDGYLATLDPELEPYHAQAVVAGEIRS